LEWFGLLNPTRISLTLIALGAHLVKAHENGTGSPYTGKPFTKDQSLT